MKALTFKNHSVVPFDNGDGKIWFTAEHLADLLEYKDVKQVNKIFHRHKDEFTENMTTKVTVSDKSMIYGGLSKEVRLFSPRFSSRCSPHWHGVTHTSSQRPSYLVVGFV